MTSSPSRKRQLRLPFVFLRAASAVSCGQLRLHLVFVCGFVFRLWTDSAVFLFADNAGCLFFGLCKRLK